MSTKASNSELWRFCHEGFQTVAPRPMQRSSCGGFATNYVFMLIVIASCVVGSRVSSGPPIMDPSTLEGLNLLANHWPTLVNSTAMGSQVWNFSTVCGTGGVVWNGLACQLDAYNISWVMQITLSTAWGSENATDVLAPLGDYFASNFTALVINFANVSVPAQTSLFTTSLTSLSISNAPITGMGLDTNLTGLTSVTVSSCPNLINVPSFSSATGMVGINLLTLNSLTTVTGASWPPATSLIMQIVSMPALTSLPPLSSATQFSQLVISDCNLLQSITGVFTNILTSMTLNSNPLLNSIPNLAIASGLHYMEITNCPNLDAVAFNVSALSMTTVILNSQNMTSVPTWICSIATSVEIYLENNNIASIPSCLCNVHYTYLYLDHAGDNSVTWIPPCLFNSSYATQINVEGYPNLVLNSTAQNTIWNLPQINSLYLPSSFLQYGLPALGSVVGSSTNSLALYITGTPINASIPDPYFNPLANVTMLSVTGLNITGTLPSSLGNLTKLTSLFLFSNSLQGTVPQPILQLPKIQYIDLSLNNLSGALPNLTGAFPSFPPAQLYLTGNFFNLCSDPTWNVTAEGMSVAFQCRIGGLCPSCTPSWTGCLDSCRLSPAAPSSPPVAPPPSPIAPPLAPPATPLTPPTAPVAQPVVPPTAPPLVPVSPPQAPPTISPPQASTCSGAVAPSAGSWNCSTSGQWISVSSVASVDTVTFNSSVSIVGNLSTPLVALSNFTETVAVSGCVTNVSSVVVTLNQGDLDRLSASSTFSFSTLLSQSGSDCTSISSIPVSLVQPSTSCQQASASTSNSTASSLNVVFSIQQASSCGSPSKLWWIILASVIGGVVVFTIVIVAIVFKTGKCRRQVLPYRNS